MRLAYAFLADYAQVEAGKIHVIGGGVTVLWRPEYPAPMAVTVVLGVAYNNTEAGSERSFQLQLNDADGSAVVPGFDAKFVLPPRADDAPTRAPLEAAFAVSFPANVPVLPGPGDYVIEVTLDDNHVRSLSFAVAEPRA